MMRTKSGEMKVRVEMVQVGCRSRDKIERFSQLEFLESKVRYSCDRKRSSDCNDVKGIVHNRMHDF